MRRFRALEDLSSKPVATHRNQRNFRNRRKAVGALRASPSAWRQRGFSLLEAVVTMAILSIGLLGLAFLQAQGLRFNSSAYARTQASILASDIIDRIRLNVVNADTYASTSSSEATPSDCSVTSALDAGNDLDCWYLRLRDTLPGGDGQIAVDGNEVTVTIEWRERPGARHDENFDPDSLGVEDLVRNLSMSVAL